MKKIGLLFGSFNPVHYGHLMIANYIKEFSCLDEIWFIITPHNPHKDYLELCSEYHRLNMVKLAIENIPFIKESDVEFELPKPSYTINTINKLQELYIYNEFFIIMGSDNYLNFDKWYKYNEIVDKCRILVYPRVNYNVSITHRNVELLNAPKIEISSSFIRNALKQGKNLICFLPDAVYSYIKEHNLYSF
ncbi:MAG: nicotinate (nicotinamide) nucleotide adenylyltransferase [Bacteroidales bacterium]|nr:nicotinate (nicotinamide) nucleotide adenylyltransferase [Bacteroidales bacterium]